MRRSTVLVALASAVAVLLRKQARASRADKDVWTAATAASDLR